MSESDPLQKTVLHSKHLKLKAKMVPFSGWSMPVQYRSIVEEHMHTREQAGLFDIGHMGEFMIRGTQVSSTLDKLISTQPSTISVGKCRYGLMLNKKGGVIDDAIAYRMAEDEYMLVVNGATRHKDLSHIKEHLGSGDAVEDISDQTGKIDIQGPKAFEVVKDVLGFDLSDLKYFSFKKEGPLLISRTGYTGELGVEIYTDQEEIVNLWDKFLSHESVLPIGLGARDTLRLECGYSLYGHELDEETPALYCGVDRFITWDNDFLGKESLLKLKDQPEQVFVAFQSENKSAPRAGERIVVDDVDVGVVTSGSFSPNLGFGIGVGRISRQYSGLKNLQIDKGRRKLNVEVCASPFYVGTARKKISI